MLRRYLQLPAAERKTVRDVVMAFSVATSQKKAD
jgi:hypothetical protein